MSQEPSLAKRASHAGHCRQLALPLDAFAPYDAYALAVVALASTLDYLGIWLKAMRVVWNKRASPS